MKYIICLLICFSLGCRVNKYYNCGCKEAIHVVPQPQVVNPGYPQGIYNLTNNINLTTPSEIPFSKITKSWIDDKGILWTNDNCISRPYYK